MSEPVVPASDPGPGLLSRAIGMITSPKATFEKIVANPKPAGILFVVALIVALAAASPQFTEAGRQATLDMQVKQQEQWTGKQVSDEQYARMEQMSKYGIVFGIVGTFIFLPVVSLIFAGLYFVAFNAIMGGTASFKQVLAVVTHSQVIGAVGAVAGAPIQLMRGTISMAGPFNLGALVPMVDESSTIARVLGSVSVFTLWGLIVTGIGLGVLYRRKGGPIGVVLIVVYLLIVFGIVALFSRGG
jgi:hypothetical protein